MNDDLQIILENDSLQVEQKLKIYSDEISLTVIIFFLFPLFILFYFIFLVCHNLSSKLSLPTT